MGVDDGRPHSVINIDTSRLLLPGEPVSSSRLQADGQDASRPSIASPSRSSSSSSSDLRSSADDESEPLVPGPSKAETSGRHVAGLPSLRPVPQQTIRRGEEEEEEDLEAGEQPQCRICLESDEGRDFITPCRCKGSAQFVHRECLDQWRSVKEGFAFTHCTTCKMQYHIRVHAPLDAKWRAIKFRIYVTRDALAITLLVQAIICFFAYLVNLVAYGIIINGAPFKPSWGVLYLSGLVIFFFLTGIAGCVLTIVDRRFRSDIGGPCRELCACCFNPFIWSDCHCCGPLCLSSDCSCLANCAGSSIECLTAGGLGEAGAFICVSVGAVVLVVFAIVGLFYSLVVAAVVAQRIWQRHNHILAKRMLTKEYVIEDLSGQDLSNYTPPALPLEHEKQLRDLGLLG